jgi:hypothetical protein
MGGTVVIRPDTAITHVIYDGRSASMLARELGLDTLSELPEGTVCVKWDWVVRCKIAVSRSLSILRSLSTIDLDPVIEKLRGSRTVS